MKTRVTALSLSLGLLAAVPAQTPPPNPSLTPPGPPANGVFKTLNQVEPRTPVNAQNTPGDADSVFKITSPGSYYLTAHLQGVSGKYGIEITASQVFLDLNGFTMKGAAGSLDGIYGHSSADVRVSNGTLMEWGKAGITSTTSTAKGWILSGLALKKNARDGIDIWSGVITNCTASENNTSEISTSAGISIRGRGAIVACVAEKNNVTGIACGLGVVDQCSSGDNFGTGFKITGGTVSNSQAASNTGHGFDLSTGAVAQHCTATFNGFGATTSAGFHISSSSFQPVRISGCTALVNGRGIDVDSAGNTIVRNVCRGNSPDNGTTDTDYQIVAGNAVGTIVTPNTSAAINGNSGGGIGTTDPGFNIAD